MSFDLCAWRENRPITASQALRTYCWLCGDETMADADEAEFGVEQDERVDAFHTELLSAYPPLEGAETAEANASPWSMTPDHLPGRYVITIMGFSDAPDVAPVIIDLAMRHGLVCYDPQAWRVHNPPEIVGTGGLRLEFCDGGIVNDPAPMTSPSCWPRSPTGTGSPAWSADPAFHLLARAAGAQPLRSRGTPPADLRRQASLTWHCTSGLGFSQRGSTMEA